MGENMMFSAEGTIRVGKEERKFRKSVEAKSEKDAENKIYALFGSQSGLKRSAVKIGKIEKEG